MKAFFEMLTSILLIVDTLININSRTTGQPILLNDEPLEQGHYDLFCAGGKYIAEFIANIQVISVIKTEPGSHGQQIGDVLDWGRNKMAGVVHFILHLRIIRIVQKPERIWLTY
jgi:hypothetical protein